ncbi:MAG TPA: PLP-dependent aminotransferase family protein [Chloroflexota bacterium]|nr:PLP-dependent aminotransferase family protein [Chloroflexota bacterium]
MNGVQLDANLAAAIGTWKRGSGPLYRRLAGALRTAMDRGDLVVGSRLPPERVLATAVGVSRSTAVAAYDLLASEGRLQRRQGSGTRVAPAPRSPSPAGEPAPPVLAPTSLFRGLLDNRATVDLLGAYLLGADRLPAEALAGLSDDLRAAALGSGYEPLGYPPLRRAVAAYLSSQGLPTVDEQILITNGAQQAIWLLATHYVRRGDAVVMEDPTYPGAIDVFATSGARLVPVPVDEWGADVEAVGEAIARASPQLVYLIPTYHNPVGGVMPERRRRDVARLAEETGVPVVDDMVLAGLSIERGPPRPLAAFSASGQILTIGSLSKLCWGGLRVGWVRAPQTVIARLGERKALADLGSSLPGQVLATRALAHIEAMAESRQRELVTRLDVLTQELTARLPSWTWRRPDGGVCLWVRLPAGSAEEFARVALEHGVAVAPGPILSPQRGCSEFLRLPFGQEPHLLREGVARLAHAWEAYAPLAAGRRSISVVV